MIEMLPYQYLLWLETITWLLTGMTSIIHKIYMNCISYYIYRRCPPSSLISPFSCQFVPKDIGGILSSQQLRSSWQHACSCARSRKWSANFARPAVFYYWIQSVQAPVYWSSHTFLAQRDMLVGMAFIRCHIYWNHHALWLFKRKPH